MYIDDNLKKITSNDFRYSEKILYIYDDEVFDRVFI